MTTIKLVRDLMTVGVPSCALDTPFVTLARKLLEDDLEAIIVLDSEGHAVGVVSRDKLVQAVSHENRESLTAEAIMSEDVPQIPPDIPLAAAAQIMQDRGVRALYIMHNAEGISYPAAWITYTHLLRYVTAEDHDDLKDLGIKAEREPPLTTFFKRRDEARRQSST